MYLSNDLKTLLSIAAIGAGIYIAFRLADRGNGVPYDPYASDYYDPYSTADPTTAYAGTVTPMDKQRYSPRTLKTSPAQMTKIEVFEGRRYTPYRDSAGNLTIGVGHLIKPADRMGIATVLNDAQIDALYAADLLDAEDTIYNAVTAPLSQGEFDALIDFAFQFGATKFNGSTLLRLLNARNYEAAAAEFGKWTNVNGVPNSGVTARRADDARTFLA